LARRSAELLGQLGLQGLALVREIEQVALRPSPPGLFERTPDGDAQSRDPGARAQGGGVQLQ
jgi:hypothetical protein